MSTTNVRQRKRQPHYVAGLGDGKIHDHPASNDLARAMERHVRTGNHAHKEAARRVDDFVVKRRNISQTAATRSPSKAGPWEVSVFALLGMIGFLVALFLHLVTEQSASQKKKRGASHRQTSSSVIRTKKKKTDEWSEDEVSQDGAYRADSEDHVTTLYYPQRFNQQHRHRKLTGGGGGGTSSVTHSPVAQHPTVIHSRPYYHHHTSTAAAAARGTVPAFGTAATATTDLNLGSTNISPATPLRPPVAAARPEAVDAKETGLLGTGLEGFHDAQQEHAAPQQQESQQHVSVPGHAMKRPQGLLADASFASEHVLQKATSFREEHSTPNQSLPLPPGVTTGNSQSSSLNPSSDELEDKDNLGAAFTMAAAAASHEMLSSPTGLRRRHGSEDLMNDSFVRLSPGFEQDMETPRTHHIQQQQQRRSRATTTSRGTTPKAGVAASQQQSPLHAFAASLQFPSEEEEQNNNDLHLLPVPFIPDLDNKGWAAPPGSVSVEELQLSRMESGNVEWSVQPAAFFENEQQSFSPPPLRRVQHQEQQLAKKQDPPIAAAAVRHEQPIAVAVAQEKPVAAAAAASDSSSSSNRPSKDARSSIIHKRNDLTLSTDASSSLTSSMDFNELKLKDVIGGGGFGQVWRATWRGTPVAVKVLTGSAQTENVSKSILEEFAAEINMLKGMRHPNICLYMGACFEPPNRAIVTELAANGSLWDALRMPLSPPYIPADGMTHTAWPLVLYESPTQKPRGQTFSTFRTNPRLPPVETWPWILVKRVASGAARGMTYLHSGNPPVLHRDLKSANLLLDDSYTAKVADFGLSRLKAQERSMTGNCGTVQWMAPEVLANQRYAEPADVYSFGIILWELLTRECPYEGMSAIQCALAVLNRDHRPEIPNWCPPALAALIKACLEKDPSIRPTFSQIISALDAMP